MALLLPIGIGYLCGIDGLVFVADVGVQRPRAHFFVRERRPPGLNPSERETVGLHEAYPRAEVLSAVHHGRKRPHGVCADRIGQNCKCPHVTRSP